MSVAAPAFKTLPAPPRAKAMAPAVPAWEWLAAGLCLIQMTEPLFAAIFVSQGIFEPQPIARVMWLPVYAFVLFVLIRDWRAVLAMAPRTVLLGLLAVMCWLSFQWSVAPDDTIRRALGLSLNMAFGLYLAWRFEWRRLLALLAASWGALIVGCYVFALFFAPWHVMRDEHPGAWSGLWTHKNTLASIMAFGIGALLSAAIVLPKARVWALIAAAAALGLILLSTGRTALLAVAAMLALLALCWAMRRGPVATVGLVFGGAAGALILGGVMVLAPEILVTLLGRDLTFTGRTDIWESLNRAVAARPWLGYGYGAFWVDEFGPRYWIQRDVQWKVLGAHNGWLEIMLAVGKAGLVLFLAQLAVTMVRAARFSLDPVLGVLPPALLAAMLIYSLSEGYLLGQNIFWVMYVLVSAKLAIAARPSPHLPAPAGATTS